MGQDREDDRRGQHNAGCGLGVGAILAAFGLGALAGAVAVVLTTPESGSSVRQRLKRGAEAARHELDETVGEAGETWKVVGDDARRAIKTTTTRIKEAAQVTKEALMRDGRSGSTES
jgi:gas vesicle protein